ncbi:HAMP domain-containing sensor histidine kinase [uncultured Paenibacillus sp.]|uniref:HAMP domain-containing sensor histidine kinase n=1 Tax=uncultured Paenibacillus sp. TaxID=227322 RepID=UPI0028D15995|nr:HAMP domain-containing sensor histidine kinase [uncultured Paenibacillus sp.]
MKALVDRLRLQNSLLSKYLLILLCATVLLPIVYPLVNVVLYYSTAEGQYGQEGLYQNGAKLERMWHDEADKLGGLSAAGVDAALRRLKGEYPLAAMYRVDGSGRTGLVLPGGTEESGGDVQAGTPASVGVPEVWTPGYTVRFMKERINGDPFTIVAFIGGDERQGFMVFEVPRAEMISEGQRVVQDRSTIVIAGMLLVLALFLFVSLMFFYRIRRRLVRLQTAMTAPSENGIPSPVEVYNEDEIGRLEGAFNGMIGKLQDGRRREAEEEALRRDLIAKLSHDLRTPMTAIRAHAFGLKAEPALSDKGRTSVELIERKIGYLGRLIENLFSYTLLSARKYPYRPADTDIVRLARTLIAGWYPVFEEERLTIELDLPEETGVRWTVDPEWMERVLDNYVQNVLRHAKNGRYVRFAVSPEDGGAIVIEDRGPGMSAESAEQGAVLAYP